MEETKRTGIVYLMTNDLFAQEGFYKFGCTANPFQRMKIQRNCTPPSHAFKYVAVIFSESYKEIENELKVIFTEKDWIDNNDKGLNGGFEWLNYKNVNEIVDVYKNVIRKYNNSKICFNGKCLGWKNDELFERKKPKCDLKLLGINNGSIIKLSDKAKTKIDYKGENAFAVLGKGINVNGNEVALSTFIKERNEREGKTNEYNGCDYFTFKGVLISELWQALTNT